MTTSGEKDLGERVAPRCPWVALSWRFADERDCLSAFLALEAAEVLAGAKPANLFRLGSQPQPCGRDLYALWQRHGAALLKGSSLHVMTLRTSDDSLLLLAFDRNLLRRRLQSRGARAFLHRCGYPPGLSLEQTLEQLRQRVRAGGIPHEIGVFLGYPLKDVAGFMGWHHRPVSGQRLWKIYGRPDRSLALARRFEACRSAMAARLSAGEPPMALLAA